MKWAVGGWSFFIVENLVLSENRSYLISRFGDDAYHLAYGALSTAAMTSIAYAYVRKVRNSEPLLWSLTCPAPLGAKVAGFVCLGLGLGIASQMPPSIQIPVHFVGENVDAPGEVGDAAPLSSAGPLHIDGREKKGWQVRCPFDFTDNKETNSPVHGLERITRHPGLWSFGLLGLGNAFLVPSLSQRAWLAMPALVALIGGAHTDSRFRRGMGGELPEEYDRATSNVPFFALASGYQGNVLDVARELWVEAKPLNAMIAVGVSGIWVLRKGRGVNVNMPLRSGRKL